LIVKKSQLLTSDNQSDPWNIDRETMGRKHFFLHDTIQHDALQNKPLWALGQHKR
jgi:hypothetical protein